MNLRILKPTILFALLNVFVASAQEFELGKVSKAELEEKAHPLEPNAEAAILFEKGESYFDYSYQSGFTLVTEVSVRIKIYTKEGYDWATEEVGFYSGNSPETVNFSKAFTYNLVNGQIEKTKLKSESEFVEKTTKLWSVKKITLPNVKEGSVIEYKYEIRSPYASSLPTWTFQSSIPVNYSKYVTRIPEYYTYNSNFKGYIPPKRTQKLENYRDATTGFSFTQNVTTYVAEKMPSMQDEEYVDNIRNYMAAIDHELSMIKHASGKVESFSTDWDDLVKTIYESDDFGGELKKNSYFEEDIKPIIANLSGRDEKIAAIFNYVKNSMTWNKSNSYYCNDGVRQAYKNKTGNAAEINLMLTAMLRYAGISANPVLVSTKANGIAMYPNRTAYNYVIAAVEINNGLILLDATDRNALPDILPLRALNWEGRLIRETGSSVAVSLVPKSNSKDIINIIAALDNQGKLTGTARDQYFDYKAFIYRANYNGLSKDSYLEKLEKKFNGIEISDYTVQNDKELSKPVVEGYTFSHEGVSELVGDRIYFSPLLFFAEKENPFKQETREYPVDFIYPHQDKYMFTINIPEGYAVESLPAPASLSMEENLGSFKFNISSNAKQIQIAATLDINQGIIPQTYYNTLKNFYMKVIEKHNEKIVLKKV